MGLMGCCCFNLEMETDGKINQSKRKRSSDHFVFSYFRLASHTCLRLVYYRYYKQLEQNAKKGRAHIEIHIQGNAVKQSITFYRYSCFLQNVWERSTVPMYSMALYSICRGFLDIYGLNDRVTHSSCWPQVKTKMRG